MVEGDSARLRQLVMILVDNAIRHSPPGGEVRVAVRTDGGAALLDVEDDGPRRPARGHAPCLRPVLAGERRAVRRDRARAGDREVDRRPPSRHDHGLEPGRGRRRPVPGPAARRSSPGRRRVGVAPRLAASPSGRCEQSISDGSHVGPLEWADGDKPPPQHPTGTPPMPPPTRRRPPRPRRSRRRRWPLVVILLGRAPRRRPLGVLVPVPATTPASALVGAARRPPAAAAGASAPPSSADPSPARLGRGVERVDRGRPRRHVERRPVGRLVLGLLGLVRRLPGRGGARERRRRDRGRPDARRDRQPDASSGTTVTRGGLHGRPRHAPERHAPSATASSTARRSRPTPTRPRRSS